MQVAVIYHGKTVRGYPTLGKNLYGPFLMVWRGCCHGKRNIAWKIVPSES